MIQVCHKCDGKGEIKKINWEYGIVLPFAFLVGAGTSNRMCKLCKGLGFVEVKND